AGCGGAGVVPPVPAAADPGLALVAVDAEAGLAQVSDGGELGATGTDDTGGLAAVVDRLAVSPHRCRRGFAVRRHRRILCTVRRRRLRPGRSHYSGEALGDVNRSFQRPPLLGWALDDPGLDGQ